MINTVEKWKQDKWAERKAVLSYTFISKIFPICLKTANTLETSLLWLNSGSQSPWASQYRNRNACCPLSISRGLSSVLWSQRDPRRMEGWRGGRQVRRLRSRNKGQAGCCGFTPGLVPGIQLWTLFRTVCQLSVTNFMLWLSPSYTKDYNVILITLKRWHT